MGSIQENEQDVFDYIVCGGGTSGCVLAGRLAEALPDVKILLIEAGKHNDEVPASMMGAATFAMSGTEHDWNFVDEGSKGTNGRKIVCNRGKVLGGSSAINGTYCVRGPKADFDQWELEGWSGEEVYRLMRKAETFVGKDTSDIVLAAHGDSGPLLLAKHPSRPIDDLVYKAYVSQGIPWAADPFTTGESPHVCGPVVCTVASGLRSMAAAYVGGKNKRANITILTEALVDKVICSKNSEGGLWAESVQVVLHDKTVKTYKAKEEIILSAGAYSTPPILLRSGIGPKAELEKLGVEVILDSPGVGKNSQDHLLTYLGYEINQPGLTSDHLIWHQGGGEKSGAEWGATQTGFFANFPFGTAAWARLDDRLEDSELWRTAPRKEGRDPMGLDPALQPHVELLSTECFLMAAETVAALQPPPDGVFAISIMVVLFGAQSRGYVALRSIDPTDDPIIQNNFFDSDLDTLVMAEGCRLANEMATKGEGLKDVVKGPWPRDRGHMKLTERQQWEEYAKKSAHTSYHPCATCSMGKDGDEMAVVDEELRVRGVKGLRVVDVSVIPTDVQGHTQMIAYAVGENGAELLIAARKG